MSDTLKEDSYKEPLKFSMDKSIVSCGQLCMNFDASTHGKNVAKLLRWVIRDMRVFSFFELLASFSNDEGDGNDKENGT